MKATKKRGFVLGAAVRLLCCCTLVLTLCYMGGNTEQSFASGQISVQDEGSSGGGETPGGGEMPGGGGETPGGENPGGGGGETPPPAQPTITDVSICYTGTDDFLGYSSNPGLQMGTISSKGGTIQFDNVIYWSNGDVNRNSGRASWWTSDPAIASINSAGILTAHENGTVQVHASVEGLDAWCSIQIFGQDDSPYVTAVRITDDAGNELGAAPVILEQDLSTAMKQFYANVDVTDPLTGAQTTYSTRSGSLSSQTGGKVANLYWYVGDGAAAAVDELSGLFRPSRYGTVGLYASSSAGMGGEMVRGSVTVTTKDPNGGAVADAYHPQNSLTVKAYYELYTPEEHGDEAYVIDKTYSLSDLYALGTLTSTYTALSSGNYWTLSGTGVPLSSVLADAGVNIAGVSMFEFGTADNIDRPISKSYIFDTNRYYYPNIDINSYADAQQVFPILAFTSVEVRNESTSPDYSGMVENTRFRLLFGSTPDGGTSQYQIKWIHTLYVVLAGGPALDPGDGDGGGAQGGDGSGTGLVGVGGGAGTTTGGPDDPTNSSAESGTEEGSMSSGGTDSGKFSVYQVMNREDSDTEAIDDGSFFERIALPLGGTVFLFGGLESYLWFKRQTRVILLA